MRALIGALAATVVAVGPATGALQEAGVTAIDTPPRAVSPDSADALRASLVRPPGEPEFDAVSALTLPFDLLALPFELAGKGLGWALDLATRPGPPPFYLVAYRDVVEWGVEPDVGSIGPRSGPALELTVDRFSPFFVETAYSIREFQRHRAGLRWSGEARRLEVSGGFDRDAEVRFWGLGPDSRAGDRVSYLRDRIGGEAAGGVRLAPGLRVGAEVGYEENRVEAGRDDDSRPLGAVFDPGTLFGFGERTEFWRGALSASLDLTRRDGFQHRGVALEAGVGVYRGAADTRADFHRWSGTAIGYLPLNPLQNLVLRADVEMNRGDSGAGVPFTHLATLGDEPGGRAYEDARFRDRDRVAATAEWRYEIWRELQDRMRAEGFVFFEEGTTVPDLAHVSTGDLHPSYGVGLRIVDPGGIVGRVFVADGESSPRYQLDLSAEF